MHSGSKKGFNLGTFGEYIKSAISSIRNNKGRSFLTMLGIIIGIAAVLTVLIIGDGMKATINGELDSIGATSVSVSPFRLQISLRLFSIDSISFFVSCYKDMELLIK